jgi:hypothetical protein
MALGSIREVQAILDIADLDESFVRDMDVIAASAFKLIRSCQ